MSKIPITLLISFFIGTSGAWAQEWQDIQVQVNGQPYMVNIGDPHFVQVQPNSIITGNIHTTEPETPICTLQDCTSTTVSDSQLGGFSERFTGVMQNTTEGAKFQVLNGQDIATSTIIFVNPPNPHMFDQPDNTPEWEKLVGIALVGLGLIPIVVIIVGVGLGIYATVKHFRNFSKKNRRWRN